MTSKLSIFAVLAILLLSGLVAPMGVMAQEDTSEDTETEEYAYEAAELYIDQPSHIDSPVDESQERGMTVYETKGEELRLYPENFEKENVVESGIVDGSTDASFSWNKAVSAYVLEPEAEGSYEIYWVVSEEVVVSGEDDNETTTETRQVEYRAAVVASDTESVVVNQDSYAETQEKASNWDEWSREVKGIFGSDADVERQTERALSALVFLHNPASYLTGDVTAVALILFTTRGGNLVLLLLSAVFLVPVAGFIAYRYRREALEARDLTVEEKLDRIDKDKLQSALSGMDIYDAIPDGDMAEVFQESLDAENLYEAYEKFTSMVTPRSVVRDRLTAMANAGYQAVVVRDSDGDISSGRVVEPDAEVELEPIEDDVVELDNPDDDLVDALFTDELVRKERLHHLDVDYDSELVQKNLDEINEEMSVMIPADGNREDKEIIAEYLIEMLLSVMEHDYTDNRGKEKPVRRALNNILCLYFEAERHKVPMTRYYIEHLLFMLDNYSVTEEAEEVINQVQKGNLDGESGDNR